MPASSTPTDREPLANGGRTFEHALPVGHVGGMAVRVHWSVLVLFGLLTDVLAVSELPGAAPHYPAVAYWLVGSLDSLAFVVSLAVHELAHALTARRLSVPTRQVTLWMLGGLTEFEHEPETPKADAIVAGAGPVASLVVAAVSATAAWLLTILTAPRLLTAALTWLAVISAVLALFNLLPGSPLDGGRLLRALLWQRSGNKGRANGTAARAGSALGWSCAALGLMEVVSGYPTGLWLVMVGAFLAFSAASQRLSDSAVDLREVTVAEVMHPAATLAPSWWTVARFVAVLEPATSTRSPIPVVDPDGQPVGTLDWQDLARLAERGEGQRLIATVARDAGKPLLARPNTALSDLAVPLRASRRCAIVMDAGRVVGTVIGTDIAELTILSRLGWRPPVER